MSRLINVLKATALAALLTACSKAPAVDDAGIADEAPPPGVPAIGAEPRPATFLEATRGDSNVAMWRVSDDDTIVYLLGTVHLMKDGIEWKTPLIKAAFEQADATFLEADIFSKEAQRAMGLIVTRTAELKDNKTLRSFYNKKEQEQLDEALKEMGLGLSDLDAYRPWFAGMQVGMLSVMAAGGDISNGADVLISREMLQRGTPIRYLETAAQQISALAAGNDETDARYLIDIVDDLEEGEVYYADLVGAWYDGDVERLDYLLNNAFEDAPELRERVLFDRNADWAQQIDRVLTDEPGTYLVAVGAGHLVGDASLQDMLRGRGYDVERL